MAQVCFGQVTDSLRGLFGIDWGRQQVVSWLVPCASVLHGLWIDVHVPALHWKALAIALSY